MKKVFTMALGLLLVAGATTSCKKGENDPGLSLTSRKARVAGEWTVTSSESTGTSSYSPKGGTSTSTSTASVYDGAMNITTYTDAGVSFKDTSNYTMEMVINKDGSYTSTTVSTYTWGTTTTTVTDMSEGSWAFVGKSKTSDVKNKEGIILSETSNTSSSATAGVTVTSSYTQSAFSNGSILMIDRLKSKEMVVLTDSEWSSVNSNGDVDSNSSTGTMTLTHN